MFNMKVKRNSNSEWLETTKTSLGYLVLPGGLVAPHFVKISGWFILYKTLLPIRYPCQAV